MELQSVQRAAPVPPAAREAAAPAPHVRPPDKAREGEAGARDVASHSEDQVRHAGANVGIPPAIDAAHPRIRVDDRIQQIIAQIVDENDVVVRQIPPEAQVRLAVRFQQAQGIFFDKRV